MRSTVEVGLCVLFILGACQAAPVKPALKPAVLEPQMRGQSVDARRTHYAQIRDAAPALEQSARSHSVERLTLAAANDPDLALRNSLREWLWVFAAGDFSQDARAVIHQMKPKDALVIRLMGAAGIHSILPTTLTGSEGWAQHLAKARTGDTTALKRVIAQVEGETNLVRKSKLLQDLAYTRRSEAINALHRLLNAEQRLPSTKGSAPGVLIAVHAAAALATAVHGFPVKEPTPADLPMIRAWAQRQASLLPLNR